MIVKFQLFVIILFTQIVCAKEVIEVGVVYPKIREPYAALYRDYVAGIVRSDVGKVIQYSINGTSLRLLESDIASSPAHVYIGLGNKSVKTINKFVTNQPIVGAVTNRDYDQFLSAGILLKPSADVYLENLLEIATSVRQIFVVYNADKDMEIIEESKNILSKSGIEFISYSATNLHEAAKGYRQALKRAGPYAAIWLLSDPDLIDGSLLSMILDAAWKNRLVVFSSNPVFVKHGALFAIYPDNQEVGYTLGLMAADVHNNKKVGLRPLREVRLAMNERTRNHLGIDLSPKTRSKVEFLMPGNQ